MAGAPLIVRLNARTLPVGGIRGCAADVVSMWDATRKGIAAIRTGLAANDRGTKPKGTKR